MTQYLLVTRQLMVQVLRYAICEGYDAGARVLPDIYTHDARAPEGECIYIRQGTLARVITFTYVI